MNFIKKLFDKKRDALVHIQFQKFSKGEFRNRAIIEAKNSSGKYTIKTSAEFANDLVRIVAEKLGNEKTRVAGAIVSTQNLESELNFKDIKQFQGVKRYLIDNEMSGEEIISLLDKFPKNFFALTFSTGKDETSLKIKPKAPKSGKPGSKGEEMPKADFCILKTKDLELAKDFIPEKPNFKTAQINHTYFVESINIPKELKKTGDFARMREEATRKGRIVREAHIDGEVLKKEVEFEA